MFYSGLDSGQRKCGDSNSSKLNHRRLPVTIKNFVVALLGVVVVCFCCGGLAQAQSCLSEPEGNACFKIYGFQLGQTHLLAGSTCFCGNATTLSETDCWVPLCSKHAANTCPWCGGQPISFATGNTSIGQQD